MEGTPHFDSGEKGGWSVITDLDAIPAPLRVQVDTISREARRAIQTSALAGLFVFDPRRALSRLQLRRNLKTNPRHETASTVPTFIFLGPDKKTLHGLATVHVQNGYHTIQTLYVRPSGRSALALPRFLKTLAAYAKKHDTSWQSASLVFDQDKYATPLLNAKQIEQFGAFTGALKDDVFGDENRDMRQVRTTIPEWINKFEGSRG